MTSVVRALREAGLGPLSGLLVALGLADLARDWDVTVDASEVAVVEASTAAGIDHRDATMRPGGEGTRRRPVIDGGDHEIDLLVSFALQGPNGSSTCPAAPPGGGWLPLGDPGGWARAYALMERSEKAALLTRWLAERSSSAGAATTPE